MWLKKNNKIKFDGRNLCPIIQAQLFNREVLLLVDSGSDISYIDKYFFEHVDYNGDIKPSKSVVGAEGVEGSFGQIKTSIVIGKCQYELPMTIYSLKGKFITFGRTPEERPIGIIGCNFLHVYHFVLDFDKRILYEHL